MAVPRLNKVIKALEEGQHAFSTFVQCEFETAVSLQTSKYDSCVFEGEHVGWDPIALRNALQFMLNRGQIAKSGSLVPNVTPMARIPANGIEKNQFLAKQALDVGCYGVVWPHISSVEEAYNAVAACRYPRLKNKPLYEPRGEIFVIIQIEDTAGITNLPDMLKNVPGIGAVLIGEGDLSQELGYPRQYEHKVVLDAMAQIVDTCKKHNVVVGHPHVEVSNVERVVGEGYRFLMCSAPRSYNTLTKAMNVVGRS